jgi:hypothetical protein
MSPPYPGQGKPLPREFSLKGVWIARNLLAFTHDEMGTRDESGGVINKLVKGPTNNNIVTFDATEVAKKLAMPVTELLEENAAGRLSISNSVLPAPAGVAAAMEFKIICKGKTAIIRMHRSDVQ